MVNLNDFGDLLTFLLAAPASQAFNLFGEIEIINNIKIPTP